MKKERLFWLGLLLCLLIPNALVLRRQSQLDGQGKTVYLALAPVDPRSLMAGDYMSLSYALSGKSWEECNWPSPGAVTADLDAQGRVLALKPENAPPSPIPTPSSPAEPVVDRARIIYKVVHGHLRFAPDAFFIPENSGGHYAGARYGIFRLTEAGELLLKGLADKDLKPL